MLVVSTGMPASDKQRSLRQGKWVWMIVVSRDEHELGGTEAETVAVDFGSGLGQGSKHDFTRKGVSEDSSVGLAEENSVRLRK